MADLPRAGAAGAAEPVLHARARRRASVTWRLRYWFGSLKLRLALASVALIAVSVGLTVVLVLSDMERRGQRAALDAQSAEAERYAELLSSRLVQLQRSLRAAASRLPVDRVTDEATLDVWFAQNAVLRSMFDTLFVLTPAGHIVVNVDEAGIHPATDYVNPDAADRAYFKRTMATRRGVISEPIVGRDSHEPQLVLTMPVFDRDGAIVAVMGAGLSLLTHPLVSEITRSGGDANDPVETVILDAGGHIVSHPDQTRVFTPAVADRRLAAGVARWTEEGAPVDPQGAAFRLDHEVVAFAGVPDADWIVMRSAPAELLLGGPAAGRRQAIEVGAAVALAGGGVVLLVLLVLLRPLRALERRAVDLLDDRVPAADGWPSAGGELGELTRVFRHVMRQRAAMQRSGDELFRQMQAILAHAPVGIAFTRHERFELVSAQCEALLGASPGSLVGRGTRLPFETEEDHRSLLASGMRAFAAGHALDEERRLRRVDGTHFWARVHGAAVAPDDPLAGAVWIFTDVTESRLTRERLSWSATHDPLTGLVNRWEFERRLAQLLDDPAAVTAALFIDLDRFKAVNDTAGHAAGDEVLRGIGLALAGRARAGDTVARVGGDEFAMLLRGCDAAAAEAVAHDVCARVRDFALERGGVRHAVGASVGVVTIDGRFDTPVEVMAAADAACYEAKRAGRDAVRLWRAAGAVPPGSPAGGGAEGLSDASSDQATARATSPDSTPAS